MNSRSLWIIASLLSGLLLLTACQYGPRGGAVSQAQPGQSLVSATQAPVEPSSTPRPTATKKLRPTATATQDAAKAQANLAESAVRDYFAALEKGDFEQAAGQLSSFSLTVFEMTRGDAAAALHQQMSAGARWSGLSITENRPFDDHTLLVRVTYTLTVKDAQEKKDEIWPVRLESNAWRCNWNKLIDYHTLEVPDQTINGVTMKPTQINRFSDRIQLIFLAQNRTNEAVVFGQANEILGTFHFGDQSIVAEKTQIILHPLRTDPDVTLEVKGLFSAYPDSIEIRKWKNYKVQPWYVFQLD